MGNAMREFDNDSTMYDGLYSIEVFLEVNVKIKYALLYQKDQIFVLCKAVWTLKIDNAMQEFDNNFTMIVYIP
jgi:hypothetical protein